VIKKTISFFLLLSFLALILLGFFLIFLAEGLPDPSTFDQRIVPESTKIYDRTGEILLYEIHGGEKRTIIGIDEMSPYIIKTTLAAEDHNFYNHYGFSFKGFARSIIHNLSHPGDLRGGSTITQQLARNAFLTIDKTLVRKLKEAILTVKIEKTYSKDQILEMYLNQINYGHNVYGIESASNFYYSKETKNLTLAEAAYLTSLIQSPNYLSPFGNHLEDLENRKTWILSRVKALNYYSSEEIEKAQQEKVIFTPPKVGFKAPHFVMFVRNFLYERFGEEELEKGGYTIITTLDMRLQNLAEELVEKYGDINEKKAGVQNLSLLAEDPKTGQILAMVGSRDYWNLDAEGNVNTTLSTRQPGSSFKPIVYATAFKKGFLPESIIFDAAIDGKIANFSTDPQNPYLVRNYDEKTRGPVTFRQALAQSLNIPSVKILYLAGIKNSIKTAQDFGITTLTDPPEHYGLSLVLGGGGVKLIEMVHAYTVFNQEGIYHPQTSILKIKNKDNQTIEEFTLKNKVVLDSQIARLINSILSDNAARAPTFGWNNQLYFSDFQAAAKTGTDSEYRDAWTIGYTTSLVSGVWAGNNDRSIVSKTGSPGSMLAAPCWHEFMEKSIEFYPPTNFIEPLPYANDQTIKNSIPMLNGSYINTKEYKNIQTEEIVSINEIHNILYYINKDNLLDSPLTNPSSDPQFWNWEIPVLLWAQKNIVNFSEEYNKYLGADYIRINTDATQTTINFPDVPKIEFLSPESGSFIDTDIDLIIKINSPIEIINTQIYLNKILLGELNKIDDDIYSYKIGLDSLINQNEIKIEAVDGFNQKSAESIIVFR